ncbi:MAG: RNA-binding transcriptional accessory protein [Lachnospiraceae bacterium]|nr:RNA-binding transcriptional accessory protein [Lachnospiraceae bacterium]
MTISQTIAKELNIKVTQVEAAIALIDEGNTIPFIARYRKEATGQLNDEQLRDLFERLTYLRNLEDKKQQVIATIEEQGKLTAELRKAIEEATTMVAVEDLYRPYRPKRRTRATDAKEKGLDGLAEILSAQQTGRTMEEEAENFLSEEKGVTDVRQAIQGAMDIVAETVSDSADYRNYIRDITMKKGLLHSEAKDKSEGEPTVYDMYKDFSSPLEKMSGYRVLAVNRGENEKVLAVSIEAPEEDILRYLEKQVIVSDNPNTTSYLKLAVADAYRRLIAPSIEREIRNALTEDAEDGAIKVFDKNLEQLLMQPPIAGKVVLGWDPAFRTGCKLAVVDATGKVLYTVVIYPTEPQKKIEESKAMLKKIIAHFGVDLISLGNGTASRESEKVIVELLSEIPRKVSYAIVNEAGASVYSASKLATEEFPKLDVGARSAASIARRLQDPLAELVKIEPQAIGVGQYQHDMNQKKLAENLGGVVEDCVNRVGVDVNTASVSLLEYVSGINKTLAKNIVSYREENGSFRCRRDLLKVAKLGPKAYEQCAGFLRIRGGEEVLDNTGVHPESYAAAYALLTKLGFTAADIAAGGAKGMRAKVRDTAAMAAELGVGEITLTDIIGELEKPSRDPREDMPKPILRSDVLEISDLKPGMMLKGTVRNVIDFGAFVDIGVHQDGLVHISELSDEYVKHPLDVVKIGDIVDVRVLSVDEKRKRIQLSMRSQDAPAAPNKAEQKKKDAPAQNRGDRRPKGRPESPARNRDTEMARLIRQNWHD